MPEEEQAQSDEDILLENEETEDFGIDPEIE
jgi:hypothetical protein